MNTNNDFYSEISHKETSDIENLCRTCMSNHKRLQPIFQEVDANFAAIRDFLISCFLMQMDKDDGLPSLICEECLNIIHIAYDFKQKCQNSDIKLRKILKSRKVYPITTIKHDIINDISAFENNTEHNKKYPPSFTQGAFETADFCGTDSSMYACQLCKLSFVSNKEFDNHRCNEAKIKCDVCKREFSLVQSLRRHMKMHNEDNKKNNLCMFCGKCFLRSHDLKRHTRVHTNERPYSCHKCPKSFKQSSELKEHLRTHSADERYVCTECGKLISTRNGFYVHMKIHKGEKNHECKYCEKSYVTSGELTSHINHIHAKHKSFCCTYESCTRSFVTKLSLDTHIRSHLGEKRYSCVVCKKALATSSSLREHRRTHTGEKLKKCKFCERKLANAQTLKKHIRIHTGERPFQCKLCSDRFICGSSLRAHVKCKHLTKEKECPICRKMFALSTKLRQHMRSHAAPNSFVCKSCGLGFNQRSKLHHHTRLRHFGNDDTILCVNEPRDVTVSSQLEDVVLENY